MLRCRNLVWQSQHEPFYLGTQAIKRLVAEEFPDMRRCETASLHKGIAGSRHTFSPLPPGADKLAALLQVLLHSHLPLCLSHSCSPPLLWLVM